MSHAPGLYRLTLSVPGDGTNGVTIDAAATGEPERSWTVIDHPFLSFIGCSLSAVTELKQLVEVLGSDKEDLLNNNSRIRDHLKKDYADWQLNVRLTN